ncbi:MAG TPA: aminotransferase class I/II-fold pyridoxal phosphate-dependent enzyme [Candidatus Limnocylindria bacterium]|nr:aminotransferase class I/II-fold pyridoxal phosphate-dependent enzyme [Candidatus Limnocylindria bacterium]
MSDRLPRPRADLTEFAPYRTQQLAAEVRVHANEWADPNPASDHLATAELEAILLNRYPTAHAGAQLREALSGELGVAPDQLIFGNGSNEVLLYAFLAFGGHGRTTLLFQPTYSMHGRLTQTAGGTVADEPIGLPYDLSGRRALAALDRVRPHIVCFTTPNNPTGNLIDESVILAAAERYPETLVLVDEAYSDFAGNTIVPALAAHPNIVVTKTFSKARAAAGLRLGVLIADPRIAGTLRAVQLPYNVSPLVTVVAGRIARRGDDVRRRIARCATERERVYAALRRAPGVEAFPSVTNFILFRLAERAPADVHATLLEHGVLVRDVSGWPGCAGCLRVSIGTPAENDRVIAAIDAVFSAVRA